MTTNEREESDTPLTHLQHISREHLHNSSLGRLPDSKRIEIPAAERDLSNLKKPMLFQCAQCKQILANSSNLVEWKRIKDNSFLLFRGLDESAINITSNLVDEERGSFAFCSYKSLICTNCNSKVGMLFMSATSACSHFLNLFTLIEQSILRYDLGDTIEVDHSYQTKQNRNLNETIPNHWTPSTAGRLKEERKTRGERDTPKILDDENMNAFFQNFQQKLSQGDPEVLEYFREYE